MIESNQRNRQREKGRSGTFSAGLACLLASLATLAGAAQPPSFVKQWGGHGSYPGAFDLPSGIAIGEDDRVYVTDYYNSRVQVFDLEGRYITQWQGGDLSVPTGIEVANGRAIVCDSGTNTITVYSLAGVRLFQIPGLFDKPQDVAFRADGSVFVAGGYANVVHRFTPEGVSLGNLGALGSDAGKFHLPHGVAFGPSGELYVTDTANNRVQVFDATGAYLRSWGGPGNGPGQLCSPDGIALDAAGDVLVVDRCNNRVQKFTATGEYLAEWGRPGSQPGEFDTPVSIAIDRSGNIFIVDSRNDRIQKFSPTIAVEPTTWGRIKGMYAGSE